MRLCHGVEVGVQGLPEVARGEEGEPFGRDGVNPGELVRELEREAGRRVADDPAADRLALDALHRERFPAVDLAEVGERLGNTDACLAGCDEHLELVSQRKGVAVDDTAAGPADEQSAPVGSVDCPGLLRGAAGKLDRPLDAGGQRLLQRFLHSASSARARIASTCGVETRSVVAPDSRHAASRSANRSFGPTSATSSTNASGTAAAASRFFPSR